VKVTPDWDTAYYTDFSGSSGKGSRPLVVSYASSPPAEVFFATLPPKDAPTGSIAAANTCFRQVEFVGILSGTKNRELAQKWIDFMLSKKFQEDMPLNMFVYPVLNNTTLPEVFVKYSAKVESPLIISPEEISKSREALIKSWTEIVVK
jgi:thiamine transport system substrate-binding protein